MRARLAIAAGAAAGLLWAVAPAHAAFPQSRPNDPLFDASPLANATDEQWDLAGPAGGYDRGIDAEGAWPLSTGTGTLIADVDVGVQLDHPDLAGQWWVNPGEAGDRARNGRDDDGNGYVDDWRGWDFYAGDGDPTSDTRNNHGTNVAGVLAATADNGIGIAGVAPGARILPLRTADNILHQGRRLAEAIVYAADRGAVALSMSLGADSFTASLRRAVDYAHRRGAVLAVASGNEFHFHHHQPQALDDVLAVGGVNPDTATLAARDPNLARVATSFTVHASYADYGPHLDLVAPTQVPTTDWGGGYRMTWDGTSAATPHVAGAAALVVARARSQGLRLSAGEVAQLLRQTADDLADPAQGYRAGWDRLSGWGRVDAAAAVRRAGSARTIPPDADIDAPAMYEPVRGRLEVRGTVTGRSATEWTLEVGDGEEPAAWRTVATGRGDRRPRRLAGLDAGTLAPGGHTLRLRARDADGNLGEDRAFFTVPRDPSLKRGFPIRLGTSGESSPVLADLNRDRRRDVILATSDGRVRAYSGSSGRMLRGWPRAMPGVPRSHPAARRLGPARAGFVATAAVGDVAGNRRLEVVAAGLDGRVHAWDHRGRRVPGFPFAIALTAPAEEGRLDAAVYASPVLAELDGDRKLDVVVAGADQRVYAVKGTTGRLLPGWPVLARDGGDAAKILSSPAVGDLDGDGSPEVVVGTGEVYGSAPATTGRVYAFSSRGRPVPGWPVRPAGLAADAIPLVGEGVPVSPSLADVDGDRRDEVAVAAFTGEPELYRGDGRRLERAGGRAHFQTEGRGGSSPASSPSALALGANAAFGRTAPGGPLRLFGGAVDSRLAAAQSSPSVAIEFQHLLGGWDARSGDWLAAFPRVMEGWQLPASPAVADVDGDGRAEVVAGSSGNVLHAFREDGSEPAGWPKDAAGWLLASPAVGDVDGDRRLEVVAVTRDGWLWVWDTPSATRHTEWGAFRHDERNTGRYVPR